MKRMIAAIAAAIGFAMGAWATTYELSTDAGKLANTPAAAGDVITGTLSEKVTVKIAAGATVTLRDVKIAYGDAWGDSDCDFAGITCLGDATLVLEGANEVSGCYLGNPGIFVPETCTLTIRGGGSLQAGSYNFGAGIGAGYGKPCGNIRIEGGTISANGGMGAAGIGAAHNGKCGTITITGGNVNARTNAKTGAGFGPYSGVSFSGAAGIGGADNANGGNISISGGKVSAYGGKNAAGIGSGANAVCGTIVITGGDIYAYGVTSQCGAGIGTGTGASGYIQIKGGKINASGGQGCAAIGTGSGMCGDIEITTGITGLTAVRGSGATNHIGAGTGGTCNSINIASMADMTSGYMRFLKVCDLSTLVDNVTVGSGMTVTGKNSQFKISIADGATVTLDGARIEGFNSSNWSGLTCLGNATIVLKGQNNYVRGFNEEYPGIYVPSGKTLTIQGTGALEACSNGHAAGIGAGAASAVENCGNIVINDGWITATGGKKSAGIGSGDHGSCGTITVASSFSGLITATCGEDAEQPIGKGKGGTDVTVTIPSNLRNFMKGSTQYVSPGMIYDLSTLTGDMKLLNGDTMTGTLAGNYKITIADGAMVTLSGATINGENSAYYKWAGITCEGDATIILDGTNTVKGFFERCPGIIVPAGKTLTIRGSGSLDASSNGHGAGIGAGSKGGGDVIDCGNIVIEGGTIIATGGMNCAGIGSGDANVVGGYANEDHCGNISILGGTVVATGGGYFAAGIGTGRGGTCGDITIGEGIVSVTATRGSNSESKPIGRGTTHYSTCGTITVADGLSDTTNGGTRTIVQGDLSKLTGDTTFIDGSVISGTLGGDYKITIADNAKVTLRNVTIKGFKDETWGNPAYCWAGITCEGSATIVLEGDNYVQGYGYHFPGIYVPTNGTLTIQGSGSLEARSGGNAAGIGGGCNSHGYVLNCGNINIRSGTIDAEGGKWAAGIGGGSDNSCGNIYINGGTITATGGTLGAGIGSGDLGTCGNIAITAGNVTATGGQSANGIGGSGCAGVQIGGAISRVTATCGDGASIPIRCESTGAVTVAAGLNDRTEGKTRTIASGDLAKLQSDITFLDGELISGTLKGNYKISIADGATVTLKDVTIEGVNDNAYEWAGITCEGDATIILEGENAVKGFYEDYPGIYVPPGKTLTIKGDGLLDASSNGYGTGIGGGWIIDCGNIVIAGGIIYATGGYDADAAGIGGGHLASCGDITIEKGAMYVRAEAGVTAPYSVGAGGNGSCGTVTVDGEVVGPIADSPYTYPSLNAGEYFKATLAELGYDVPTDGTPYSVTALGLPAGLKLKYNSAVKNKKGKVVTKAKSTWWIEGVPTAGLDFMTNPSYLVITANGKTVTVPLALPVTSQTATDIGAFMIGLSMQIDMSSYGIGAGWTMTGLPTGLKYTAKALKKPKVPAYTIYGTLKKAGQFTITAKKKKGAFYETKKFTMLVKPDAVNAAIFGTLSDRNSVAYEPELIWDLKTDVASVGGNVAKVTGLPPGMTFAASTTYKDKKKTQVKQQGQTIVGTPTKAGKYVVTFSKSVKSGKKTVTKTAQIFWTVTANATRPALEFNTEGGKIMDCTIGLRYDDEKLLAFTEASGATVTASGLPKGVKLVDQGGGKYDFQGYATKAGTYLVTVKATVNGNTVTQRIALKVNALPAWAKGSFTGYVTTTDHTDSPFTGLSTVSVTSAGKISGKFTELGTNWTFSAACYEMRGDDAYRAPVTAKYAYKVKQKVKGKWKTVTKYLTRDFILQVVKNADPLGGVAMLSDGNGTSSYCQQNLWGSTYKNIGAKLFYTGKKAKYRVYSVNGNYNGRKWTLSMKVTPNGKAVTTVKWDTGKKKKGKIVYYTTSCSSVVWPNCMPDVTPEEFVGLVCIYLAPSAANDFPEMGAPMYIFGTVL